MLTVEVQGLRQNPLGSQCGHRQAGLLSHGAGLRRNVSRRAVLAHVHMRPRESDEGFELVGRRLHLSAQFECSLERRRPRARRPLGVVGEYPQRHAQSDFRHWLRWSNTLGMQQGPLDAAAEFLNE